MSTTLASFFAKSSRPGNADEPCTAEQCSVLLPTPPHNPSKPRPSKRIPYTAFAIALDDFAVPQAHPVETHGKTMSSETLERLVILDREFLRLWHPGPRQFAARPLQRQAQSRPDRRAILTVEKTSGA